MFSARTIPDCIQPILISAAPPFILNDRSLLKRTRFRLVALSRASSAPLNIRQQHKRGPESRIQIPPELDFTQVLLTTRQLPHATLLHSRDVVHLRSRCYVDPSREEDPARRFAHSW
jgi:hypothetical protein